MAFWKQKPASLAPGEPTHWPIRRSPALVGALPCSEHGCPRHDAVQCAYTDRRGTPCMTAWCSDHQRFAAGRCLCRRHASLADALQQGEFLAVRGYPDTANRAPSLVNYVSRLIESRTLALLEGLRQPREVIGEDAVHLIRPATGGRRWVRGWQIFDHTGVIVRVAVAVEESDDPAVELRVGHRVVARGVPPWIARHRLGLDPLSAADDAAEKERFATGLFERVERQAISDAQFNVRMSL